MTTRSFTTARENGRSDPDLLFDLTADAEPTTIYEYPAFIQVLSQGVDVPITRGRVIAAVQRTNRRLLRERNHYLANIRGRGYRIVAAEEHLPLAMDKRDRAQHQLQRGTDLLRHVNWHELSATQRQIHEAQLIILDGLYQATRATARRTARLETIINQIQKDIADLKDKNA